MTEIWTMGEMLAEIMRPERDLPLDRTGPFLGPFPSGAPAIFIDTVARLGHSGGIVSAVGADEFGTAILERLRRDGVRLDQVAVLGGRSTGVAFVAYAADGSRSFLFHWDGTPAVMAGVPPRAVTEGATYFHVMGCSMMANEVFRDRLLEAVEQFADQGARITFDPNIRMELLGGRTVDAIVRPVLRRCSVLFPGASELRVLGGETDLDCRSCGPPAPLPAGDDRAQAGPARAAASMSAATASTSRPSTSRRSIPPVPATASMRGSCVACWMAGRRARRRGPRRLSER